MLTFYLIISLRQVDSFNLYGLQIPPIQGLLAGCLEDQADPTQISSVDQLESQEDTHVELLDHADENKQSSRRHTELGIHL